MKLIIDIDEENYKEMCEYGNERVDFDLKRMIQNGTPIPDNATNGDVVKLIFDEEDIWDIQTALNLHSETMGWWHSLYCED